MPEKKGLQKNIDLSRLYPDWPPERLARAEYNLTRYIDVIRRIYERVNKLTDPEGLDTLQ